MISFGVAWSSSARSFTTICGGMEIGPVGFVFAAEARRSWGRCAGVVGRGVLGRAAVGWPCVPGRAVPGAGFAGRCIGCAPCCLCIGRCVGCPLGCLVAGAKFGLGRCPYAGREGIPGPVGLLGRAIGA